MSAILALLGYEVNVVCYSKYLSERDRLMFNKFFTELEISEKISYGTLS